MLDLQPMQTSQNVEQVKAVNLTLIIHLSCRADVAMFSKRDQILCTYEL